MSRLNTSSTGNVPVSFDFASSLSQEDFDMIWEIIHHAEDLARKQALSRGLSGGSLSLSLLSILRSHRLVFTQAGLAPSADGVVYRALLAMSADSGRTWWDKYRRLVSRAMPQSPNYLSNSRSEPQATSNSSSTPPLHNNNSSDTHNYNNNNNNNNNSTSFNTSTTYSTRPIIGMGRSLLSGRGIVSGADDGIIPASPSRRDHHHHHQTHQDQHSERPQHDNTTPSRLESLPDPLYRAHSSRSSKAVAAHALRDYHTTRRVFRAWHAAAAVTARARAAATAKYAAALAHWERVTCQKVLRRLASARMLGDTQMTMAVIHYNRTLASKSLRGLSTNATASSSRRAALHTSLVHWASVVTRSSFKAWRAFVLHKRLSRQSAAVLNSSLSRAAAVTWMRSSLGVLPEDAVLAEAVSEELNARANEAERVAEAEAEAEAEFNQTLEETAGDSSLMRVAAFSTLLGAPRGPVPSLLGMSSVYQPDHGDLAQEDLDDDSFGPVPSPRQSILSTWSLTGLQHLALFASIRDGDAVRAAFKVWRAALSRRRGLEAKGTLLFKRRALRRLRAATAVVASLRIREESLGSMIVLGLKASVWKTWRVATTNAVALSVAEGYNRSMSLQKAWGAWLNAAAHRAFMANLQARFSARRALLHWSAVVRRVTKLRSVAYIVGSGAAKNTMETAFDAWRVAFEKSRAAGRIESNFVTTRRSRAILKAWAAWRKVDQNHKAAVELRGRHRRRLARRALGQWRRWRADRELKSAMLQSADLAARGNRLRAAWKTWKNGAADRERLREIGGRISWRIGRRTSRGVFAAWLDLSRQLVAARDQADLVDENRALKVAWRSWKEVRLYHQAIKAAEEKTVAKRRAKVLKGHWESWRTWKSAAYNAQALVKAMTGSWDSLTTSRAWSRWRKAVALERSARETAAMRLRVTQSGFLNRWKTATWHSKLRRGALARALAVIAGSELRWAFNTWRRNAVTIARHKVIAAAAHESLRKARLRTALSRWKTNAARQARLISAIATADSVRRVRYSQALFRGLKVMVRQGRERRAAEAAADKLVEEARVARAWSHWKSTFQSVVVARTMLEAATARGAAGKARRALLAWQKVAEKQRRVREVGLEVEAAVNRRIAIVALSTWSAVTEESIRSRDSLERAVKLWRSAQLGSAFRTWLGWTEERLLVKSAEESLSRLVVRNSMASSWRSWKKSLARARGVNRLKGRIANAELASAFQAWRSNIGEQVAYREAVSRAVNVWRLQKVGAAFRSWIDYVEEKKAHEAALRKATVWWKSLIMVKGWNAWIDYAEVRRWKADQREAADDFRRGKLVPKMWSRWIGAQKMAQAAEAAFGHAHRSVLKKSFGVWQGYVEELKEERERLEWARDIHVRAVGVKALGAWKIRAAAQASLKSRARLQEAQVAKRLMNASWKGWREAVEVAQEDRNERLAAAWLAWRLFARAEPRIRAATAKLAREALVGWNDWTVDVRRRRAIAEDRGRKKVLRAVLDGWWAEVETGRANRVAVVFSTAMRGRRILRQWHERARWASNAAKASALISNRMSLSRLGSAWKVWKTAEANSRHARWFSDRVKEAEGRRLKGRAWLTWKKARADVKALAWADGLNRVRLLRPALSAWAEWAREKRVRNEAKKAADAVAGGRRLTLFWGHWREAKRVAALSNRVWRRRMTKALAVWAAWTRKKAETAVAVDALTVRFRASPPVARVAHDIGSVGMLGLAGAKALRAWIDWTAESKKGRELNSRALKHRYEVVGRQTLGRLSEAVADGKTERAAVKHIVRVRGVAVVQAWSRWAEQRASLRARGEELSTRVALRIGRGAWEKWRDETEMARYGEAVVAAVQARARRATLGRVMDALRAYAIIAAEKREEKEVADGWRRWNLMARSWASWSRGSAEGRAVAAASQMGRDVILGRRMGRMLRAWASVTAVRRREKEMIIALRSVAERKRLGIAWAAWNEVATRARLDARRLVFHSSSAARRVGRDVLNAWASYAARRRGLRAAEWAVRSSVRGRVLAVGMLTWRRAFEAAQQARAAVEVAERGDRARLMRSAWREWRRGVSRMKTERRAAMLPLAFWAWRREAKLSVATRAVSLNADEGLKGVVLRRWRLTAAAATMRRHGAMRRVLLGWARVARENKALSVALEAAVSFRRAVVVRRVLKAWLGWTRKQRRYQELISLAVDRRTEVVGVKALRAWRRWARKRGDLTARRAALEAGRRDVVMRVSWGGWLAAMEAVGAADRSYEDRLVRKMLRGWLRLARRNSALSSRADEMEVEKKRRLIVQSWSMWKGAWEKSEAEAEDRAVRAVARRCLSRWISMIRGLGLAEVTALTVKERRVKRGVWLSWKRGWRAAAMGRRARARRVFEGWQVVARRRGEARARGAALGALVSQGELSRAWNAWRTVAFVGRKAEELSQRHALRKWRRGVELGQAAREVERRMSVRVVVGAWKTWMMERAGVIVRRRRNARLLVDAWENWEKEMDYGRTLAVADAYHERGFLAKAFLQWHKAVHKQLIARSHALAVAESHERQVMQRKVLLGWREVVRGAALRRLVIGAQAGAAREKRISQVAARTFRAWARVARTAVAARDFAARREEEVARRALRGWRRAVRDGKRSRRRRSEVARVYYERRILTIAFYRLLERTRRNKKGRQAK